MQRGKNGGVALPLFDDEASLSSKNGRIIATF